MRRIRLLALDVDGTLTNGRIYLDGAGGEFKAFHVHDGMGIAMLRRAGIRVALISGRRSDATERRAEELEIDLLYNGVREKLPVLLGLMDELGISPDEAAYMGDDVNDVECLRSVGTSFAPCDAVREAKEAASTVTAACGGEGAVREAAELILAMNGAPGD
ncbi:MAG: HAD-IIIA family hydrolase [Synergistota bacterium]|nr:HAD-IIIA family hydrolase [Synergistota bacterium]